MGLGPRAKATSAPSKGGPPPPGWWQASDGLFYPADQEPGPSEASASQGSIEVTSQTLRRTLWTGVAFGGLALLAALFFVVFVRQGSPGPIEPGMLARGTTFALDIAECPGAAGEFAAGSIRNDTDQVVSFRIELPFVDDSGAEISIESVVVDGLRPLEASRWTMGPAPAGTLDCAGDSNQVFYEQIKPAPEASEPTN